MQDSFNFRFLSHDSCLIRYVDANKRGVPVRHFVLLMIFVFVCLLVAGSTLSSQTKAPDLIIVNARIYTVDSRFSTAEGVAIDAFGCFMGPILTIPIPYGWGRVG